MWLPKAILALLLRSVLFLGQGHLKTSLSSCLFSFRSRWKKYSVSATASQACIRVHYFTPSQVLSYELVKYTQ